MAAETPSEHSYRLMGDEDFERFKSKVLDDEGWNLVHQENKFGPLKTWTKKTDESPIDLVKMWCEFNGVTGETLYDVLHDADYRSVWDDKMIAGYRIQELDATNEISYYAAKAPPTITNRDFLNMRSWRALTDAGEWIIMNHSELHPDMPPQKSFVRGESILTGYLVRRKEGGCILNYLTHSDPKGWIPNWVINTLASKYAPKILAKLYEACLAYEAWKEKQGTSGRPPSNKSAPGK